MYKTVRQGENCLQYHILPQDDHTKAPKRRRSSAHRNRMAFILVITLILGCAIVAAAVLVPALMASNVTNPPPRFQTFAVAASSVNMRPHGKYSLQGAQYIALMPVKDPLGHLNAYQLKPSLLTSGTTTSNSATDAETPHNVTSAMSLPRWIHNAHMPWVEPKSRALILSLIVALVMLLAAISIGLCIYVRRFFSTKKRDVESDHRGTLLVEGSGDEE